MEMVGNVAAHVRGHVGPNRGLLPPVRTGRQHLLHDLVQPEDIAAVPSLQRSHGSEHSFPAGGHRASLPVPGDVIARIRAGNTVHEPGPDRRSGFPGLTDQGWLTRISAEVVRSRWSRRPPALTEFSSVCVGVRPSPCVAAPAEGGRIGYLDADAAARAPATMAIIASRTCSPVVHSPGKPRRTAARPAGLTAIISKP